MKRNRIKYKAVMEHGYRQTETVEVARIHYSRVSRIVKKEEMSKDKT